MKERVYRSNREEAMRLTTHPLAPYAGSGDIFMPGVNPGTPELQAKRPQNGRPTPESPHNGAVPAEAAVPHERATPGGEHERPVPEQRMTPENSTQVRLDEMKQRVAESTDAKQALVEELLKLPSGTDLPPEDELFREISVRTLYEFGQRHDINKHELMASYVKEAEKRIQESGEKEKAESGKAEHDRHKPQAVVVESTAERKGPLGKLREWFKRRKKKKKEEKEEKAKIALFKQYEEYFLDEAIHRFPGFHITAVHIKDNAVLNNAYGSALEISGMREGQFKKALEKNEPQAARLFTEQFLKGVEQKQKAEVVKEQQALIEAHRPKTIDEARQQAQIFVDTLQESGMEMDQEEVAKAVKNLPDELIAEVTGEPSLQDYGVAMTKEEVAIAGQKVPQEFGEKVFEHETPEQRQLREDILERHRQQAGAAATMHGQMQLHQNINLQEIPSAGFTDDAIKNALEYWNEAVNLDQTLGIRSRDVQQIIGMLQDRLSEGANPLNSAEAANVNHAITQLREMGNRVQGRENTEALQGEAEEIKRRQYLQLEQEIQGETGISLTEMLIDRHARNEAFNDLFAAVDRLPHEFFAQAFNPLTYGRRYEFFTDWIGGAATSKRNAVEGNWAGKEKIREAIEVFVAERKATLDPIAVADPNIDKKLTEQFFQEINDDLNRYQKERQVREVLHNANAILYRPRVPLKDLMGFIEQFQGDLADIAQRMPGIRKMKEIYEQEFRASGLEHGGYIRDEDIRGRVRAETVKIRGKETQIYTRIEKPVIEDRAKEVFRQLYDAHMIYVRAAGGEQVDMKQAQNNVDLQDWELERLMTITRGMMIAEIRMLSMAAENQFTDASQFNSFFQQDALQEYSPQVHLNTKWGAPGWAALAFGLAAARRERWLFGLARRPYSTAKRKREWESFKKDQIKFAQEHPDRYINQQNPNKAGDLYTHLGFRAGEATDENESITRDFLLQGRDKRLANVLQVRPNMSQAYEQARRTSGLSGDPTIDQLKKKISGIDYPGKKDDHGQMQPATQEEIIAKNIYIYLFGDNNLAPQEAETKQEQIKSYIGEYGNWIGTGLRFELQRDPILTGYDLMGRRYDKWWQTAVNTVSLNKLPKDVQERLGAYGGEKLKKTIKAIKTSEKLLDRIVKFQPDKLFLKSHRAQRRMMSKLRETWKDRVDFHENGLFSEEKFQHGLRESLESLNILQEAIYKQRDRLLTEGYSFEGTPDVFGRIQGSTDITDLKTHKSRVLNLILDTTNPNTPKVPNPDTDPNSNPTGYFEPPDPNDPKYAQDAQRYQNDKKEYDAMVDKRREVRERVSKQEVWDFYDLMQQDFVTHKAEYHKEFIFNREQEHGFVLWSGDAPVDEFAYSALGGTGAFGRKASDNLGSAACAGAMMELFIGLKYVRTQKDAVELISKIYGSLSGYDGDLAKVKAVELARETIDFFGADWQCNIPVWGGIFKYFGKGSLAQRLYGRRASVWQAAEKRNFLTLLKDRGQLTDEAMKNLITESTASAWKDIPLGIITSVLPLLAAFFFYYMLKKATEKE